ncbi:MAG TPA: hypothetical protein VI248_07830 [Kineosporiaceae bacterium]
MPTGPDQLGEPGSGRTGRTGRTGPTGRVAAVAACRALGMVLTQERQPWAWHWSETRGEPSRAT